MRPSSSPASQVTAVVLAGGRGRRLAPLTVSIPKEMIPVWGKPLLSYILENVRLAGVEDVIIVSSPKKLNPIKTYYQNGKPIGLNIRYAVQRKPLGPAHAISVTERMLHTDYFLVQHGDSIANVNIPMALLDQFSKYPSCDGILALRTVDDPSRYGIVWFEGKRIKGVVEKPKSNPPSNKAVMGTFVLKTESFFRAIKGRKFESDKEEFPPQYMLERGATLGWYLFRGQRVDVGRPEDLFACTLLLQRSLADANKEASIFTIVFDSDNTLFNTRKVAERCDFQAMKILSKYTRTKSSVLLAQWKQIVGKIMHSGDPMVRSRMHSYKLLGKRYGLNCHKEMYKAFQTELGKRIKLATNAKQVLRHLKSKKLALTTEDDEITTITKLNSTGITKYFDEVVTSSDIGVMKPSPDYYQHIIQKFGESPWNYVVVGDSFEKDLIPAIKLGMHTLLVRHSSDLKKLTSLR